MRLNMPCLRPYPTKLANAPAHRPPRSLRGAGGVVHACTRCLHQGHSYRRAATLHRRCLVRGRWQPGIGTVDEQLGGLGVRWGTRRGNRPKQRWYHSPSLRTLRAPQRSPLQRHHANPSGPTPCTPRTPRRPQHVALQHRARARGCIACVWREVRLHHRGRRRRWLRPRQQADL